MKEFIAKSPVLTLLILAVTWSGIFAFTLQLYPHFSLIGDDPSYLDSARMLYIEEIFSDARPVVISALFGLPYLFGASDQTVIDWGLLLNYLSWLATVILVFKTAEIHFSRKISVVAALSFMVCAGNLANAFNLLSEPIFILLLTLAVYCAARFQKRRDAKYLTFAIVVLLLGMLVKPVSLALLVVLAIIFRKNFINSLRNRAALLILPCLTLILVQLHEMKITYGDYTLSYVDAITYYNYVGAKADCMAKGIVFIPGENARAKHFQSFPSHIQKKMAREDMAVQLRENTVNLVGAYIYCLYSNTHKGSYIISQAKNTDATWYFAIFKFAFQALTKLQNIIFTIGGVLLSIFFIFKPATRFHKLLGGLTLGVIFVSGMSCFQCDRFHIAVYPMIILMAASFYERILLPKPANN